MGVVAAVVVHRMAALLLRRPVVLRPRGRLVPLAAQASPAQQALLVPPGLQALREPLACEGQQALQGQMASLGQLGLLAQTGLPGQPGLGAVRGLTAQRVLPGQPAPQGLQAQTESLAPQAR